MPDLEPVVLEGRKYALRHIGPRNAVFATSPASNITVLQSTTMVARPLPMANQPDSTDFVSGSWTGRLGDAGEMQLTFPNKEASDGVAWRNRFDPSGHLQWIEIYNDEYLEAVCCIDKVDLQRDQITVSGHDGFFLLKKAYERDWTVIQSPRDVIERATQVWVPQVVDTFPPPPASALTGSTVTTPYVSYTYTTALGGSLSLGAPTSGVPTAGSAGLTLSTPGTANANVDVFSPSIAIAASGTWRITCSVSVANLALGNEFQLNVNEDAGQGYTLVLKHGTEGPALGQLAVNTVRFGLVNLTVSSAYNFTLESDGEWVSGYINGMLVGQARRTQMSTTHVQAELFLSTTTTNAASAIVNSIALESLQPFLQRGSDKGDYVLPGSVTTYPPGGLHARYSNNTDLQSDANVLAKIHAPSRMQSYGTAPYEYQNQLDAQVSTQANPIPGATTTWWSCIWFGSIYLKASAGNYLFSFSAGGPANCALRVWIIDLRWGQQQLDTWTFSGTWPRSTTPILSNYAGTRSYGGGTVVRDGWYPIKIEYAVSSTAATAPAFNFTPPASYTDPGGTALTGGVSVRVPSTSLSPLGCIDQRYQGISHFDLAQQTAQAVDYQISCEPKQLESALFPGVLAPRIREGQDFDVVLQPDDSPRQGGDGILNYGNALDATDFCASLQGNGAGQQTGSTGQLQMNVYDPATLLASLFDVQGWQDFSDAAFPSLLQGLLNAQLGLRLTPWQIVSADPIGRPRLAYGWPLPASLAQMRWRPGDGLRVLARDVNVQDTAPRQMLLVTRQIHPSGITGTTAGLAAGPSLRPRAAPSSVLKQVSYQANRWARVYQKQKVTLSGPFFDETIAATSNGQEGGVVLQPGDQVISAVLRVAYKAGTDGFQVYVNNVDQTSTLLGGTPGTAPIDINLLPVLSVDSTFQSIYYWLHNNGASGHEFIHQLFIDVLR